MTKFSGGAPAGTIETVAGVMDGRDVLQKPPSDFKVVETKRKGSTKIVGLTHPLNKSTAFNQWTLPFFMAHTNSSVVRRTNSLLGYSTNLSYTERWGFPNFGAALMVLAGFIMSMPYIALPLLRGIARAFGGLPKANAGAKAVTLKSCVKGSCCMLISASGKTEEGKKVRADLRIGGVGDVGVAFTAVCHGEISVLLSKRNGSNKMVGCLTPIAALGNALPDALTETGLVFIT